MKIGLIQIDCHFGKKEHNLQTIAKLFKENNADLWVLPELFNTGYLFTSTKEVRLLAEEIPGGKTSQFLIQLAKEYRTTIIAGLAENENGTCYNASVCIDQKGLRGVYRKIHLFDREKLWFQPGNIPFDVINLGEIKIGMMICFDWIFPEAARSLALKGAEIICHPANLVLPFCQDAMITRCLENRVYAITANRIGVEERAGMKLKFTGWSEIVSPRGDILIKASKECEEACVVDIDPTLALEKNVTPANHVFGDRRTDLYYLS